VTTTAPLYEGKAKRVFAGVDPELYEVEFKDDFTAFNGEKRAQMAGKGQLNNEICARLYGLLEQAGVRTHLIGVLSDRRQLVWKARMLALEVVVRNRVAGSLSSRLGMEEGSVLAQPVVELYLKNDALGDPLINRAHARALGIATDVEMDAATATALQVNAILGPVFAQAGLVLVDFKLEFGYDSAGRLLLADEISPDTCRLWDAATGEKRDKDRFRRDLGGVIEAYADVLQRLRPVTPEPRPVDRTSVHAVRGTQGSVQDRSNSFVATVTVNLKKSVLDPQGAAVLRALQTLGYATAQEVRIGKHIELRLQGENRAAVRAQVTQMCERLLANTVIETYAVDVREENA
jgi:phosphoribosylaminoimidazole-succinocarboxamide synthase